MTTNSPVWSVEPDGTLSESTIDRIDSLAPQLVTAVQVGGTADVDRLTSGMDWVHAIALAISVATLVDDADCPDDRITAVRTGPVGWSTPALRDAHAAYGRGDRSAGVREGELIYQRAKKRASRARRTSEDAA